MTLHAVVTGGMKATPGWWTPDPVPGEAFGYDWSTAEPPC